MITFFQYSPFHTTQEVRKLIAEGIEDVHVDPFLEEACARDINTYCKDLPKKSGNGES